MGTSRAEVKGHGQGGHLATGLEAELVFYAMKDVQEAGGLEKSWGRLAAGVQLTRISAPALLRFGAPSLLEVDLVGAAFVLGLGEEAQRTVPPDAQPQAPGLLLKINK